MDYITDVIHIPAARYKHYHQQIPHTAKKNIVLLGQKQKIWNGIKSEPKTFFIWISTHHHVRPARGHYFPTLHQMKFEVEDGVLPNARPVRFGFNPQDFPDFSWRGYAVMSPAQVSTWSGHSLCWSITLLCDYSYSDELQYSSREAYSLPFFSLFW